VGFSKNPKTPQMKFGIESREIIKNEGGLHLGVWSWFGLRVDIGEVTEVIS
jgi:hypothetical protein